MNKIPTVKNTQIFCPTEQILVIFIIKTAKGKWNICMIRSRNIIIDWLITEIGDSRVMLMGK